MTFKHLRETIKLTPRARYLMREQLFAYLLPKPESTLFKPNGKKFSHLFVQVLD